MRASCSSAVRTPRGKRVRWLGPLLAVALVTVAQVAWPGPSAAAASGPRSFAQVADPSASADQLAAEAQARAAEAQPGSGASDPAGGAGTTAPTASRDPGGSGGACFPFGICDPGAWLRSQVDGIIKGFIGGILGELDQALKDFLNSVNFLTRTPENLSYANDKVKQFADGARLLANGLLAVVAMVGGFNVLFRPYLGSTYHSAMELLPRLVLGGILVNTAAWWGKFAIDVNNAATGVFGAGPPASALDQAWQQGPIIWLLAGLITAVMFVLLVLQALMRLALVDVLLVLAPLAALCWVLPQTQGWGRLWGTLFVETVFAQFVQVLTLRLGFDLATGAPWNGTAGGLLQPLLGIAILALALKIPGLMRGGAAGGNFVSTLLGTAAGIALNRAMTGGAFLGGGRTSGGRGSGAARGGTAVSGRSGGTGAGTAASGRGRV